VSDSDQVGSQKNDRFRILHKTNSNSRWNNSFVTLGIEKACIDSPKRFLIFEEKLALINQKLSLLSDRVGSQKTDPNQTLLEGIPKVVITSEIRISPLLHKFNLIFFYLKEENIKFFFSTAKFINTFPKYCLWLQYKNASIYSQFLKKASCNVSLFIIFLL
jgi:hypothetical protein